MYKICTLLCVLIASLTTRAQYAGYDLQDHPEAFKKSLTRATESMQTIQSDFTQVKTLSMLSEKINSSGKFWYQKKDKLRMEYIRPYSYLMILNGGKIYLKEGQKENKMSTGSNKVFRQINRILLDCVAGSMLDNPDFESRIFENDGSWLVEFKPLINNLKELYKNINIVVDKKDFSVSSIEMDEISGDKTFIRFQNKELNAHIPDSVFNIP
jgi:outer membrane lipoprotein-sorting protein